MKIFTPFQHIILEHASRYPWWMTSDLYKLIHQAALGSGHAVTNPAEAPARLEQDLANQARYMQGIRELFQKKAA